MKKLLFTSLFINLSFGFIQCNMDVVGHINLPEIYNTRASDITGFYQDEREFAVVGLKESIAAVIIDITDPSNPFEVGQIDGSPSWPSGWRDIKYWNRHIYVSSDATTFPNTDGIIIVSVDNPDNPIQVNAITDFSRNHNIHIDSDGYLYAVGTYEEEHDIWIYELTDHPSNPLLVGTWDGEYIHDLEVHNNKLYGAAIYSGNFYIIDVTYKYFPQTLVQFYTGGGGPSTHDCAVTYDENYLITADEVGGGHIKIWDISNYNNINLVSEYMPSNYGSSHNVYIRPETNLVIISYFALGTRILDISIPENPIEVGFYDTSGDNNGTFDGNWGTYAYLPSGYIISSDRDNGLYILDSPLTNASLEWNECIDDPLCNTNLGDVNGDGLINILDVVQVANYVLGISTPSYECATDFNQDEQVNILDLVLITNYILTPNSTS